MFYPYGFFSSSFLLYIGVPLIIGIWAQIRVSSAFRKWGEVRASFQHHRRGMRPRNSARRAD